MNKKFLILITTLLCASFCSSVGAMEEESSAIVRSQNDINLENAPQDESNDVTDGEITTEKGYIVYFSLGSGDLRDVEVNLYLNILFKALEEKLKSKIGYNNFIIKDIEVGNGDSINEYLLDDTVVSFKIEIYNNNNILYVDNKINSEINNILGKEINDIRNDLKNISKNFCKKVDLTKIKNEYKNKISEEIKRLEKIKEDDYTYNSLTKEYINNLCYDLFKFEDIFNPYFSSGEFLLNEKQTDAGINNFRNLIEVEIKYLNEIVKNLESIEFKEEEDNVYSKKMNQIIDRLQQPIKIFTYENKVIPQEVRTIFKHLKQKPKNSNEKDAKSVFKTQNGENFSYLSNPEKANAQLNKKMEEIKDLNTKMSKLKENSENERKIYEEKIKEITQQYENVMKKNTDLVDNISKLKKENDNILQELDKLKKQENKQQISQISQISLENKK